MVTSLGPLVIAPHLIKGVQYDALKDFDPITIAVQAPNVLVVPANSPFKTVADVIAQQKKTPEKVTFASSGNGSSDHLTVELFWQQTGTTGIHIPYKGGAPAINDLLGSQVDASFQNVNAVLQHINAGKLRALAVTSDKRMASAPDVPTIAEAGVPGYDASSWFAFFLPAKTPPAIVKKVSADTAAALKDPAVAVRLEQLGMVIVGSTPEEMGAYLKADIAKWGPVIRAAGIKVNE